MNIRSSRSFGQHYAFVVVGVTFLALLMSAAVRSTPGVLLVPWEHAFGWKRDTISLAAGLGIFLYGLVGPFAAALMQSIGVKRTLIGALAVVAASTLASAWMTAPWQLTLEWGVLSGLGSGCVAMVLGATVVNRWFVTHRGLVMGLLSASTATGTLIFLPVLAAMADNWGWRPVVFAVSLGIALLIPLVLLLMRESPQQIGTQPYGADHAYRPPLATGVNPIARAVSVLGIATQSRDFWLLFATFFICGLTTNGLIGTHLIAFCADHGMAEVQAAGLMALMGVFDLIGTTGSGWLSDRFDPRKLLFVYYGVRGISLLYLPYSNFSLEGLSVFAVFYGLDWIATVPPTMKLVNQVFGDKDAPVVFGWVFMGHQMGAATAATLAGALRTINGNYIEAFMLAGFTGLAAAVMALAIGRRGDAGKLALQTP